MSLVKRVVGWFMATYPGRVIQAYAGSQAGNYAGGLAFTAFVSMFPLMLGLLSIIGIAVGDPQTRAHIENTLLGVFPSDAGSSLHDALNGIRKYSGVFGILGVVGLLWSGGSLFTGMEWALGRMIGARQRDFLRQRAMALVMTLAFVFVIVGAVGINSALALTGGLPLLGPVLGGVVWIAFMLVVYRAVPNRTYPLLRCWPGAVLAGSLMELLTLAWPLYTRLAHGFSTYGAVFALFFLLASWLYFWAQFILLGAVVNRMHVGHPRTRGLIAASQPDSLETEATRAADLQARRPHRAA